MKKDNENLVEEIEEIVEAPNSKFHLVKSIIRFTEEVAREHVGAYAAQAAFFFMLCMIPILLLLLTLVQYTPVPKKEVLDAVILVFPKSVESLITLVLNQVYSQSLQIIPVTIIVALWSAGRGVLAISTGLNTILHSYETRNYFWLRLRSTFYTLAWIVVMVLMLVLSVFGSIIKDFLDKKIPFIKNITDQVMEIRLVLTVISLFLLFLFIYKFLPNRKATLKSQVPGALFAMIGWMVVSEIFSVYVKIFKGFSSMYGSLTTIVLIMLWLYFGMYCVLLGGKLNKSIAKAYIKVTDKKEK
ncbi:MAG: YihY/virulence factor BrkB family protein [Lachnospiraceae bacterium]|jgi:membrane protein|nr:YihY/virulence factor BrkB family protein [Lachnospiraceae bacterium]